MSNEEPVAARLDERYWGEYRQRARRRTKIQRVLLVGGLMVAVGMVTAVFALTVPADQQAGPAQIQPPLTLIVPGSIAVVGLVVVRAARWLRGDRGSSE
jgi:hypothetical protein